MNPKIISVILGIVLLSSVASFSPIPIDAELPPFVCKWTQSFVENDFVDTGSDPYDFIPEKDYTHVLPGVTAYGGSFGMPVLTGTVTFSYQYEGGSLTPMTTRDVDPEYGSGQPLPFNYGSKVIRPDEREYIELTIYCENYGITESNMQFVSVKGLEISNTDDLQSMLDEIDKELESEKNTNVQDANTLYDLGKELYKSGSYEDAIEYFDQALELDSDNEKVLEDKSDALRKLQRYDEALVVLDNALEINPNWAELWDNKGSVLANLERYTEAIESYNEALKITPNYETAVEDRDKLIEILNGLSTDSLNGEKSNKIVSGDYLENIEIEKKNNEYFITAKIGQKSPNTSNIRIIAENECPFKEQVFLKDFQFRPGADVSFSFEQLSESKPSECSIRFTLSAFDGRELETIVANYYLETTDNESDYIVCPDYVKPVCGVNGITYSNDCQAGDVEISHQGECSVGDSLDSDGDGVPDSEDACPDLAGWMSGCPDVPQRYPASAPTSLSASSSDGSVLLKWQTPDDEGGHGAFVEDYIIEYKSESDSIWQVFDDGYDKSTSALITNLQNNIQYQFRVSGDNFGTLGLGDASTTVTATPTAAGGGGCLIATATYGSELSPQVQQLREIRDDTLLNTESGKSFMGMFNGMYYSFSPVIADLEREHPMFREMVKLTITPMITSLSLMEYADSEESVLFIGVSLIVLNGLMYFGIPGIVLVGIRKF